VIWQELGWFYERLEEPRRALHLYRKAHELDPGNLEAQLRAGRIELGLGQIEKVANRLGVLSPHYPDVPEVLELQGEVHRQRGDYQSALQFFERSLRRMPNRLSALKGIGACLQDTGDLAGASKAWTQAFRAFPGDASLAKDLGNLLEARGQAGNAERVLRSAIERSPTTSSLHIQLAHLLLGGRRFTAARKAYRKLLLECEVGNLESAVDYFEAQVFCRETRGGRRLARSLTRFRSRGKEAPRISLLEFVRAIQSRDPTKFSPAWQRAWRENPDLSRHGRFLAGVLEAADMDFFLQEAQRSAYLFHGNSAITEEMERLAEELTPGGALRSLPGSG
jgi:tetratricopeptide (TPR) repeat protein